MLADGLIDDALQLALADGPDADPATRLRRQREGVALVVAIADLSGRWDLERVTRALSDFADYALDAAIATAIAERMPEAEPRGFAAIALGKLGGQELNYSSDIDPIFLFDPQTLPHRDRDDVGEAAVRIGRRVIEILSARNEHGYVFRVDMRLRPSPEVTPIVLPVDAAISYYESQALAWEQAAFIRSRTCAGDMVLGHHFLDAIQPFIWRRSMDFGQIKRIGDITQRIRSAYASGQAFGPGFDLKRGRGGIREVEFLAQAHQLIHGGRNAALRVRPTAAALNALAGAGHLGGDDAAALADSYRLLRTIEHRLQMVDDQQTHSLPDGRAALDGVAALHGLTDGAALLALLRPVVDRVGTAFDGLIDHQEGGTVRRWPDDVLSSAAAASKAGFADGVTVAQRVAEWRSGAVRVLRSAAAREALEAVLPTLMDGFGRGHDPDTVLARFDRLIGGLPSAVNFFNLLAAQPPMLATLVAVLGHAPTLAAELGTRPELIEGLIDASVFATVADPATLAASMRAGATGSYEGALDHVRRVVGEDRFALGVQLVESARDPLLVARSYADVADAALTRLVDCTIAEFEAAHGAIAGAELLILALGRYGGQGLTHASDLDLILLFTGDHLAESDGDRPLGATRYFNRLGQRVVAALSVPTAAGRLYEVDTRLRPQGTQGPLVASLDAFARYQQEDAWAWEHMALTRARCVYGSDGGRAALDAIIARVLDQPRDLARLHADIVKMRSDMAAHKPPGGPLDVKLIEGGLVDAEFAVHAMQLMHRTAFTPLLDGALDRLVAQDLAPAQAPDALALLSRMLVTMRLMAPDGGAPDDDETRSRIAHACLFGQGDDADWDGLMRRYADARNCIGQWWCAIRDAAP